MNRRSFLETMTVFGAGCMAPRAPRTAIPPDQPKLERLDRIGLQLYTIRGAMAKDFDGSLARVAEIGYREVEFAGYFGRSPQQVRAVLERLGLDAPAAHVPLEALRDDWERTLEAARTIGHRYLVVPWIPAETRTSAGYRAVADLFNRAGEAARRAGLGFAYHNHDFEFVPVDGRLPYDLLLAETDPSLVKMELDLYWIGKGGRDPLDYFARHPGRFPMVHVKDADAAGRMVDVGRGRIDFGRIFARREQAGIRHFFVEHDDPAEPFDSIRASYEHLRGLEFIGRS